MKQQWHIDELVERFTLLPPEIKWLGKNDDHNHLGKAVMLKYFQHEGRFPERESELLHQHEEFTPRGGLFN